MTKQILLLRFLLIVCNLSCFGQTFKGFVPTRSTTERRLALVIGNKDYQRSGASLRNPINDADDMAITLDSLGFDVIKRTNLSFINFKKIVDEFGEKLSNYDVALFYFSGHGIQFNGENYLVPIDAHLQALSDAEDDCIRLGRVMGKMKSANVKNNIVFLDACRNNPFPKSDGSKSAPINGLVIPNNPPGSIIVFATEEGKTASDNPGERNGLFTGELLKNITKPNLSINDILQNTRQNVYQRSNGNQLPSDYNKMLGGFYFIKTKEVIIPKVEPKPSVPQTPENQFNSEYHQFLEKGELSAQKNDRKNAIVFFQKAKMLADIYSIKSSKTEILFQTFVNKGDKFFSLDEAESAKEWYLVAQSIKDDEVIRQKIKDCYNKR